MQKSASLKPRDVGQQLLRFIYGENYGDLHPYLTIFADASSVVRFIVQGHKMVHGLSRPGRKNSGVANLVAGETIDVDAGGVMEGEDDPTPPKNPPKQQRADTSSPGEARVGGGAAGALDGIVAGSVEPQLLAVRAINQIGRAIAAGVVTVATAEKLTRVVIADRTFLSDVRLHRVLLGHVEQLELAVQQPTGTTEFGFTNIIPVVKTIIAGANRLGSVLGAVDPYLKVDVARSGQIFNLKGELLQAAVAKHLVGRVPVIILPAILPAPPATNGLLQRCLSVAALPKPASDTDPRRLAIAAAEALLERLFDDPAQTGSPTLAERLVSVEGVDLDDAAILVTELSLTGGNYRLTTSFLRSLFNRDGLRYSGAAAASFFLIRASDQELLASDVLYATSGHTRFDEGDNRTRRESFCEIYENDVSRRP